MSVEPSPNLRDNLPDSYLILHNFEVQRTDGKFEIDIAIIAPHAVYLVDAKGTRGLIDVSGPKWYPEGRQPFTSPLLKLRSHARVLKGIITDSNPGRRSLGSIYVDAAVLLTAPDAVLQDPGGRDGPDVTTLKKSIAFFTNANRIPSNFSKNISAFQKMVLKALQGVAKKRTGPLIFGNWRVVEKLSATDAFTEYRAVNNIAGPSSGHVRLRVYKADPYLPTEEREAQRKRIGNAYEALNRMPPHPNIIGARDFFATEAEDGYVLVTEDLPGQALRLHIDKPNLALTLDQKIRVARDLLTALDHAHQYGVIHRNMTPSVIMFCVDGRVRLTGFDFARASKDRTHTVAEEIVDDLDPGYMAPELQGEPEVASPSSDVFSAGLILYELFTGERAFKDLSEVFDQSGVFAQKPSAVRSELNEKHDQWLQKLCIFDPEKRKSAKWGLETLEAIFVRDQAAEPEAEDSALPPPVISEPELPPVDYGNLKPGDQLTHKYIVEQRLGRPGSFGVVYKVVDTLGDVSRAVKLILRDRHSTLERLKKEYRTLLRTPEHPNVVRVYDADLLPGGGPPFIVFEHVDGLDVGEMIENGLFSPEDAVSLARGVAEGLVHLHKHGVYHCDIKPRNLVWTDVGPKIIDFNVSVLPASDDGHGGGSRRYLPPDLDLSAVPTPGDLADRDLYAFGLTMYEAVTGRYPWETSVPPLGQAAPDPRELSGFDDLTPELVTVMLKAIASKRADRYASATELQEALAELKQARRIVTVSQDVSTAWTEAVLEEGAAIPPNTNPFVNYLLTLFSQSRQSNRGTRGLDALSKKLYVDTALDRELTPAVMAGEFGLVVITGNAGDGKTAFLQNLETAAQDRGAELDKSLPNGCRFTFEGRTYLSNYDGSQDEGDQQSDDVLLQFFGPFTGDDPAQWPTNEVRLIAINEGRLVDFLESEQQQFPLLRQVVETGLAAGQPEHRIAVVNLNLRSVVANSSDAMGSILERLIGRMTQERFWTPCRNCDLKDRCYAHHNAGSFQDETAAPKLIERLQALYTLTHLRGRMHMTLRDLRSALAYMLAGTRNCHEIHGLYKAGRRDEIIQGFYFNSWMGGDSETADRLLALLKEVDVGHATDPKLDRTLDFVSPVEDRSLFGFEGRGTYDREILARLFDDLPRDFTGRAGSFRGDAHQRYVAMLRRRVFFERRDHTWKRMLPYKTADRMIGLIAGTEPPQAVLRELLDGINRGEGLTNPARLSGSLALQVRVVDNGTVRSYRLFPAERFSLHVQDDALRARFVEHMPTGLVLRYNGDQNNDAELAINLDVFEMLHRLNHGYRPSIEEEQGYCLSLAVFKNVLGSAPYQEVLLTTTGHDFFRVDRQADGRLEMNRLRVEVG